MDREDGAVVSIDESSLMAITREGFEGERSHSYVSWQLFHVKQAAPNPFNDFDLSILAHQN